MASKDPTPGSQHSDETQPPQPKMPLSLTNIVKSYSKRRLFVAPDLWTEDTLSLLDCSHSLAFINASENGESDSDLVAKRTLPVSPFPSFWKYPCDDVYMEVVYKTGRLASTRDPSLKDNWVKSLFWDYIMAVNPNEEFKTRQ